MRHRLALLLVLVVGLTGCASDRHSAADSMWPFGNPNAPASDGETAQRALGRSPAVTAIAPQTGNVWPGPVQPVPTIADIEKNMNQPLGQAYTPSLPSPYGQGQDPNQTQDNADASDYSVPGSAVPQVVPATAPAR